MPKCYFLSVCSGSAVDQHSNNVTLFNLVEQINVPPGAPPPPQGLVPVEMHAYFEVSPMELGQDIEVRFVLVAASGLETPAEVFAHRPVTPRFRTRTFGLPFPPVTGHYSLRFDWRYRGEEGWHRDPLSWPIVFAEATHRAEAVH